MLNEALLMIVFVLVTLRSVIVATFSMVVVVSPSALLSMIVLVSVSMAVPTGALLFLMVVTLLFSVAVAMIVPSKEGMGIEHNLVYEENKGVAAEG